MRLRARAYEERRDSRRMCEAALASDLSTLQAGDLQLKLCDPSVNPQNDVRLWEEDGALVGLAFVQPGCSELSFVVRDCESSTQVEAQIMDWATARFNQAADAEKRQTFCFTSAREFDARRISLLHRYGFRADEAHCIYMRHALDRHIPTPELPDGFSIRPLAGAHELAEYTAAHRNAFWMENFTEEWHGRLWETPFYLPELNLVAAAPDGTFAAFCFSWLEPRPTGSEVVRRGYLQTLGTRPRFRRMGLGRALLFETLRRFQTLGAVECVGVVEGGNAQALRLYVEGGVRPLHKIYRFLRPSDAPRTGQR